MRLLQLSNCSLNSKMEHIFFLFAILLIIHPFLFVPLQQHFPGTLGMGDSVSIHSFGAMKSGKSF